MTYDRIAEESVGAKVLAVVILSRNAPAMAAGVEARLWPVEELVERPAGKSQLGLLTRAGRLFYRGTEGQGLTLQAMGGAPPVFSVIWSEPQRGRMVVPFEDREEALRYAHHLLSDGNKNVEVYQKGERIPLDPGASTRSQSSRTQP